jgi:hypothetical protein
MLKRKGSTRGVLLVSRPALVEYLNALPSPSVADISEAAHE